MQFIATCIAGAERLVRYELTKQGIEVTGGQDRLVRFRGDMRDMMLANLWLRTANRVFIELEKISVQSFDGLFAVVESIDWSLWIPPETPLLVTATSIRSALSHTPTIQSITHKALIRRLSHGDDRWDQDNTRDPLHVHVLIVADEVHILLDTTGPALHKRGYRSESGEAPLKESLAATLIGLSQWKFQTPLYDPFCGSGTIAIEAAMMARNIAPGQHRQFDWMRFVVDQSAWETLLVEAQEKDFQKNYQISASDIDASMVDRARANARRAGVYDTIDFGVCDFREVPYAPGSHLVTNPPYGKRLELSDEDALYISLEKVFLDHDLTGGVITSVENFPKNIAQGWSHSNVLNGSEKCRFWRKS